MLNSVLEKIKSAPRGVQFGLGIAVFVVGVIGVTTLLSPFGPNDGTYRLEAKERTFRLVPVRNAAEQTKGLSGRDVLAEDEGMIFVYRDVAERCFWMQDMNFALDILWVDKDQKVVFMKENLPPESYPEYFCADAQYVIELNAGEAAKNDIKTGMKLVF